MYLLPAPCPVTMFEGQPQFKSIRGACFSSARYRDARASNSGLDPMICTGRLLCKRLPCCVIRAYRSWCENRSMSACFDNSRMQTAPRCCVSLCSHLHVQPAACSYQPVLISLFLSACSYQHVLISQIVSNGSLGVLTCAPMDCPCWASSQAL